MGRPGRPAQLAAVVVLETHANVRGAHPDPRYPLLLVPMRLLAASCRRPPCLPSPSPSSRPSLPSSSKLTLQTYWQPCAFLFLAHKPHKNLSSDQIIHSNMMATRRNKKKNFPVRPQLLLRRNLLLLLSVAAFAVSLLSLVLLLRSTSSSSPPPHCGAASLGEFGDMMLSMLPKNLPFTVFVPSSEAFRHVLRLPANDSAGKEEADHTYAVVSRVLGFSAIPQRLRSLDVPLRRQVSLLDSVSGLRLHAWRDVDGALVVNGVRSECVDIDRAEAILHVMAGVVMDAEFERSFFSELDE